MLIRPKIPYETPTAKTVIINEADMITTSTINENLWQDPNADSGWTR